MGNGIQLPVLPRPKPVYKTGASAAQPSWSVAHGGSCPWPIATRHPCRWESEIVGPPGVAPGPRRLRVGRTVSPILRALKIWQRWESNPLSTGYEPAGSPFAFAAIKCRARRLKNTRPGLAPGKIGFADRRLDAFAMRVENYCRPQDSGAWESHPPRGLHRPECCWLHHHLVLQKTRSREDSHLEPPASQTGVQSSYTSGAKGWLNPDSHQGLLGFSEALISLSYSAMKKGPSTR